MSWLFLYKGYKEAVLEVRGGYLWDRDCEVGHKGVSGVMLIICSEPRCWLHSHKNS